MVSLDRIRVHPIKSLDAVTLPTATIEANGGLAWDRRYAIVERTGGPADETGPGSSPDATIHESDTYVNGKRESAIHELRAEYDLDRKTVTFFDGGDTDSSADGHTFHLELDRDCLASWLSDYFGYPVELVRNEAGGFPDDTDASGPTVIAEATLETVASWYDGIDAAEMCRRLRPNLVVGGAPAFWEDRLYDRPGRAVTFDIGGVALRGVNPCQRCVVPTRDPETGEQTDGFRETFVERRRETLPDWASEARFDHYFRLMVNTRAPESSWGATLEAGSTVSIDEPHEVAQ